MERRITGFHLDEKGDWVADLDCGHTRHDRFEKPRMNTNTHEWLPLAARRRVRASLSGHWQIGERHNQKMD